MFDARGYFFATWAATLITLLPLLRIQLCKKINRHTKM